MRGRRDSRRLDYFLVCWSTIQPGRALDGSIPPNGGEFGRLVRIGHVQRFESSSWRCSTSSSMLLSMWCCGVVILVGGSTVVLGCSSRGCDRGKNGGLAVSPVAMWVLVVLGATWCCLVFLFFAWVSSSTRGVDLLSRARRVTAFVMLFLYE